MHTAQNLVVARLHGQMDVLAHLRQFRHRADEIVRHVARVACREPDALDAFDLVNLPQQRGQVRAGAEVVPVAIYILAEEGYLPIPLGRHPRHLIHHSLRRHAALSPAHVRHDAKGTELITPMDDVYKSAHRAVPYGGQRGQRSLSFRAVPYLVDRHTSVLHLTHEFREAVDVVYPKDQVEIRRALPHPLAFSLHQATGDPQDQSRSSAFEGAQLTKTPKRLIIGALADGTGIEQDDVRVRGIVGRPITHTGQEAGHGLRIPQVHLAALRDDVEALRRLHRHPHRVYSRVRRASSR